MDTEKRHNEILDEEFKETISLLKKTDIPVEVSHLRAILADLPAHPVETPYVTTMDRVWAAVRLALPLGTIAALVIMVSALQFDPEEGVSPFVPAETTPQMATIESPKSVDDIVETVYTVSVSEEKQAMRVAQVQEDQALALLDKEIINDLATDYEDAF